MLYFARWPSLRSLGSERTSTQLRGAILNLDAILTELKSERDRLDRAIAALQGTAAATRTSVKPAHRENAMPGRRRVTAEARRRMSESQKKRRAKEKKRAMQRES
jgi:hypothetical protein